MDHDSIKTLIQKIEALDTALLVVDHSIEFVNQVANNWIYLPNNGERVPYVFKDMTYEEFRDEITLIQNNNEQKMNANKKKNSKLQEARKLQQRRAEVFGVNIGGVLNNIDKRIRREIIDNPLHSKIDISKRLNY